MFETSGNRLKQIRLKQAEIVNKGPHLSANFVRYTI